MLAAVEIDPDDIGYMDFKPAPLARIDMAQEPKFQRRIFARRSERLWVVHDEANNTLMVVGISRPSQVGIPELWMMLAEPFTQHVLHNMTQIKDMMQELLDLYPHVKVRVDARSPQGQRFVKILGFTEFHRDTHGEREYIHYEVRRGSRNSGRA